MKEETKIQNAIRIELCKLGCIVHRMNVGVFFTKDGRSVHIGEKGHSDLYGHRPDGKAFYLEVKSRGGKLKPEQKNFLFQMRQTGAISGVVHSVDDAKIIVFEEKNNDREGTF